MKVLYFIDKDNFDYHKLLNRTKPNDKISIFTTNYLDKLEWKDKLEIFFYDDLGINAQEEIYKESISKSYSLTDKLLKIVQELPGLTYSQNQLINTLSPKIHRVTSEALKSEKNVEKIIEFFQPERVIIISKSFKYSSRIDSNSNFESQCLAHFCKQKNIDFELRFEKEYDIKGYLIVRYNFFLNLFRTKPLLIKENIKPNTENKSVCCLYLFGHMYFRNKEIYKYLNSNEKYYYLILTDWLTEENIKEIEANENLNFIHYKGLLPISESNPKKEIEKIYKLLRKDLSSDEIPYSKNIIANYLANYIFKYFKPYLKNHKIYWKKLSEFKIGNFIFPSYWEVQPSLLIEECRNNNIPTLAIQAGIHPKGIMEDTTTDKYGVFGDWDFKVLENAGVDGRKLFILGWPLGEYYENLNASATHVKQKNTDELNFLFLLAMSGSWQHFIHFPEDLIIFSIIDLAASYPKHNFSIRTHSGNNVNKFKDYITKSTLRNVMLNNSGSLDSVLQETDYVFTQSTTAGFEAMIKNIPVFCLNLFSLKDASPFSLLESKYVANNMTHMRAIIDNLTDENSRFLEDYTDSKEKLLNIVFNRKFNYEKLL